jgi:hypothetical protein
MTLEDSIEMVRYKKQDQPCPFALIIEKLSKEDKDALHKAIEKRIPDVTLANALRKEGHRIAEISISSHRRGVCRCENNK